MEDFRVERKGPSGEWELITTRTYPMLPGEIGLLGLPGYELRVMHKDQLILQWVWTKVPENANDPESFTVWSWKQTFQAKNIPEHQRMDAVFVPPLEPTNA